MRGGWPDFDERRISLLFGRREVLFQLGVIRQRISQYKLAQSWLPSGPKNGESFTCRKRTQRGRLFLMSPNASFMRMQKSETGRLVLTAIVSAGAMIAFQVAGKATRDALFLSNFPVTALPAMAAASAAVSIAAIMSSARLLSLKSPRSAASTVADNVQLRLMMNTVLSSMRSSSPICLR